MTGEQANKATKNAALATALAKAKETRVEQRSANVFELPEAMDWKQWQLPVTAALLARIPQKGSKDGDYFLKPEEAAIWAIVSYEQNLSPFTGDTYFMRGSNRVNLTLQGKLKAARMQGLNLGAPRFETMEREWVGAAVVPAKKEPGTKCILPVGKNGQNCEYTAWLSEWFIPANPNWKSRWSHMLSIRSFEKAVSFASGVGISENPDDRDIQDQEIPESNIVVSTGPISSNDNK